MNTGRELQEAVEDIPTAIPPMSINCAPSSAASPTTIRWHDHLLMDKTTETRHIVTGPGPDEAVGGDGLVEFRVQAPEGSARFLERCREVIDVFLEVGEADLEVWRRRLPQWFVSACSPEQTRQQAEEWLKWWRSLPPAEKASAELAAGWSLSGWLYWLEPAQRDWYWWDAKAMSANEATVAVEVTDASAPLGSLKWLLRAAGASVIWDSRDG